MVKLPQNSYTLPLLCSLTGQSILIHLSLFSDLLVNQNEHMLLMEWSYTHFLLTLYPLSLLSLTHSPSTPSLLSTPTLPTQSYTLSFHTLPTFYPNSPYPSLHTLLPHPPCPLIGQSEWAHTPWPYCWSLIGQSISDTNTHTHTQTDRQTSALLSPPFSAGNKVCHCDMIIF